ncbi:hypothetical protein [Nitratiruptor sp. SB155-2]|uniref:hypothetical protein n=1 Tax=Nitratiruptor sp. (strain SB155-2) TaxID=387092 RepID=UPI0001586F4B|nr:hypothetical protein [Nitratiruptor sp. SB155-2]BAF69574.1 hypothetical protein NIS_0460 [Nitratiruptor sp. SB155-2]BAN05335.1 hypothetical protein [Nitratiruptor phage NrS-1]
MTSFGSAGYYRKIVEKEAENITSFESNDIEYEIFLRNIVSRAYYTCFLHCRDKMIQQDIIHPDHNLFFSDNSHSKVIKNLPAGLRMQLEQLKNFRQKADYNTTEKFSLPLQGKQGRHRLTFGSPEHILLFVKTILEYDCN